MTPTGKTFEISLQGNKVKLETYRSGKMELLRVNIPGNPFFITKIKDADKYDVWTSIPQGQQELAERVGALVDELGIINGDKKDSQQTLF